MSLTKIKKIIHSYAECLKDENYPYNSIYLFGSHAKGQAHKWSDIDIAVITPKLKKNYDLNRLMLWKLRRQIDARIEPHGFTPQEFKNLADPLVYEIKTTGIRIK